jgi:diacylglycerol kinase family enzyme
MKRVHVIVNRRARRLRHPSSSLLAALLDAARSARAEIHETFDPRELSALADRIATSEPRAVVLAGGDGAYTAGVTAFVHASSRSGAPLPPFAFAPGGTVSTVARNWGLHGALAPYATRLVDAVASEHAHADERPSLRVRDDDGGDRVGFIWGAGLVARFFDAYYASPHAGYAGAARIVGRIFVGSPLALFDIDNLAKRVLTPVACELRIDGDLQRARGYSLMASSVVRDLGLHMHVLHRAAEDPERVHFVASPLGAPKLGPQMPLVLLGKRLRGRDHVDVLAREASVRFVERDAYVLDGDVHAAREVTVRPGPKLVLLTAPPRV